MFQRNILQPLLDAVSDTPVVFLHGARQTGKSTLMNVIAQTAYPAGYLTLDNAVTLSAASADPTGFIAGIEKPVIIDEIQRVPDLFLAIKEDVDRHRSPGRYLLTGSASVWTLPRVSEALVGRMEVRTLWPLSLCEILGGTRNVIDTWFDTHFPMKTKPVPNFSIYTQIVTGGFPEPVQRAREDRRQSWFDAYLTTILDRDIRNIAQIQDFASIPRLLRLLAARTAGLYNRSEISRSSTVSNTTLGRYMALLEMTFLIYFLPAWSANLGKRLVKAPKMFMVDTGLACHLLGMNEDALRQQGEMAGHLFENFVVLELLKHAAWSTARVRLYHYRSQSGREVDVVIERSDGKVVGVEIKLSAGPSARDIAGLKVLEEDLGTNFLRGILIYTGNDIVPFAGNIHAVPVTALAGRI